VNTWDAQRLADLWNLSSPAEPLTHEEIAGACFDGSGTVLGDECGAVAVMVRGERGHLRLLAVHPDHRRRSVGLTLVLSAERWLRNRGATTATFGADVPHYLWPGIDATNLPALALAEKAGYRRYGCAINLSIPTACDLPTEVVRAEAADGEAVLTLVAEHWPAWLPEVERGVARGTTFAAMNGSRAVAFCNHSSLRRAWIGPMGTAPDHRQAGLGRAVFDAVRHDLASRGFNTAEIAWVGPLGYFADLGATTSRVFCHYRRDL
jgi:GNAT superfamily N-acetyltransferase